jgi:hypothetical protein
MSAQDIDDGGIADRPGNIADAFHTYFGIAGMFDDLFVCLFVYLFICLFVYLFICLSFSSSIYYQKVYHC